VKRKVHKEFVKNAMGVAVKLQISADLNVVRSVRHSKIVDVFGRVTFVLLARLLSMNSKI
jgi:hypothetical protein